MKHLKKFNENSFGMHPNDDLRSDMNNDDDSKINNLLDEVYELLKLRIKSSDIEDFYKAEEMIQEDVMKYLKNKLWDDDELSDWMKKKELGE